MSRRDLIPLNHFLGAFTNKNSEAVLFIGDEQEITFGDLKSKVVKLVKMIEGPKAQVWALNSQNKVSFVAGFLALMHCKKSIVLPPNAQKGVLKELENHVDAYLLQDYFESSKEIVLLDENSHKVEGDRKENNEKDFFEIIDNENISVTFFTSGSTGKPKQINKTLANLIKEVSVLEELWGAQLDESIIFSTVSHQHIYGLLFGLLWPIATGRKIRVELFQYPEVLLAKSKKQNQVCWISSPAQLSRMPALIDLKELSSNHLIVFSSGGPLSEVSSLAFEKERGSAPIEVFGSSETGGIAWRQRSGGVSASEYWKPLGGVKISSDEEGVLLVDSPFINELRVDGWYQTNDLIEIKDGVSFVLKGRNDRIVKIEEKRLSLFEMETRLVEHSWVLDAAILEIAGDHNSRKELGAIVQLNQTGNQALAEHGRLFVAKELKKCLLNYFERILLPRKWRYVAAISQNGQGKRIMAELQKLFDDGSNTQKILPDFLNEKIEADKIHLKIKIPTDLYYLKGHFPDLSVVAGVVQIDWVMKLAEKYFKITPAIKSMENIKFFNIMQPNDCVDVIIEFKNNRLFYEYTHPTRKFSSGRITLL